MSLGAEVGLTNGGPVLGTVSGEYDDNKVQFVALTLSKKF